MHETYGRCERRRCDGHYWFTATVRGPDFWPRSLLTCSRCGHQIDVDPEARL